MCVIVDTNFYETFFTDNDDGALLRQWVKRGNGKIIYADTPDMKKERKKGNHKYRATLEYYRANGIMYKVDTNAVNKAKSELEKRDSRKPTQKRIKSNDIEILALAKIAMVDLLASSDKALCADFKKLGPDHAVYPINPDKNQRDRLLQRKCKLPARVR